MGKRARERAARRRDPEKARQHAARQLNRINDMVSEFLGSEALCVEAAALFVRTAADLGHDVEARPVALLAQYGGVTVALGRVAAQAYDEVQMGEPVEVTDELAGSGWNGAGHVVLVHRPTGALFDPTLPQISDRLGYRMPALAAHLDADDLDCGPWDFSSADGSMVMRYYLVPDDTSWVAGFGNSLHHCRPVAEQMADLVRTGRQGTFVID